MSCIVVFRHPNRIVLASDSREVSASATDTFLHRGQSLGKIRIYGRWALTLCGFSKGPNVADVREVLGRAIEPTRTMEHALAAVQQAFQRKLLPSLQLARAHPRFADLFEAVGGSVLAVFVAGKDADGTLIVGSFGVDLVNPHAQRKPLEARMYGGTCPGVMGDGSKPFYFAVGQDLAIQLATREPRPEWIARGDADAARRILEMQIDATPDCVAGPIHVLEITAGGMQWCEVGANDDYREQVECRDAVGD